MTPDEDKGLRRVLSIVGPAGSPFVFHGVVEPKKEGATFDLAVLVHPITPGKHGPVVGEAFTFAQAPELHDLAAQHLRHLLALSQSS